MKTLKNIVASLLLIFTIQLTAQQTPADKQSETITIVGATAHIGNGKVIENSIITFENGKITTIEKSRSIIV